MSALAPIATSIACTLQSCRKERPLYRRESLSIFAINVICDTDSCSGPSHIPLAPNLEPPMRMPILAYFLVVGVILFGGMHLVNNQLEAKPLPVSQRIGVQAPSSQNIATTATNKKIHGRVGRQGFVKTKLSYQLRKSGRNP